ncbi:hypothetical protein [Phaeobacter sp. 11ANDIMAR09]|uniref:hypothetical protein n=1 Tax=Phaeobacter sp. 11ANDIMAR09 TaxID=1225647 RepID=UPI0012EE2E14|nr:hypothetical protein [Phaeobacter sp. 11ANDIMAR09]
MRASKRNKALNKDWQQEEQDTSSGRKIFAREIPRELSGNYGTYDFSLSREFQVRTSDGEILLQVSGSAKGEYWCGVFLFFVDGSEGAKVRLEESNKDENTFLDVPDTPLLAHQVWE